MKLTHTRLLVKNYRDCFLFYRDILGFKATWGDEDSLYADFQTGDVSLALFDIQLMAEAIDKGTGTFDTDNVDKVSLIFRVDNVDSMFEELKRKGVCFINSPVSRKNWGIRVAHFRDPDGTLIEINERI